eukprot:COSAG04_NODE_3900_length_2438_cov_1.339034_2_plen_91_part_00
MRVLFSPMVMHCKDDSFSASAKAFAPATPIPSFLLMSTSVATAGKEMASLAHATWSMPSSAATKVSMRLSFSWAQRALHPLCSTAWRCMS